MNRFYQLHIVFQWLIALLMAGLALVAIIKFYDLVEISYWYFPSLFILVPFGQFLITPLMRLTGAYKYLSPMLLIFAPKKDRYDLHNGTSFDYLFVFAFSKHGFNDIQSRMLAFYLDGLVAIIKRVELGELEESVVIRGTSYFFSEKTANRIGFEIKGTGVLEKLNLLFNYLDLIWMYSLSKKKLSFPNLAEIKTASTTGKKLVLKKAKIMEIREFLRRNSSI